MFSLCLDQRYIGLEAVSHDGVDVYFSTFETLVSRDHNGEFVKFYDARTGGGFPEEPELLALRGGRRVPRRRQLRAAAAGDRSAGDLGASAATSSPARRSKAKKKKKHKTEASAIERSAPWPASECEQGGLVMRGKVQPSLLARCRGAARVLAVIAPARRRPIEHVEPGFDNLRSHADAPARPVAIPTSTIDLHRPASITIVGGRRLRSGMPVRAADRRDPLARGLHRQPARGAEVHPDRIHASPAARSTRRSATSTSRPRPNRASSSRSTTWRRTRTRPGCSASPRRCIALPGLPRPLRRTDSDYGLDAISTPTVRLPFNHFKLDPLGGPGDPEAQRRTRFVTPLTGVGACFEAARATKAARRGRRSAARPTRPRPSRRRRSCRTRRPAACRSRSPATIEYYGGTIGHEDDPLAGNDRLRPGQLQPEPDGEADDRRGRHRLRARHRPQGPADAEPDHAVAVGDPDDHGHPAAGLLDQPRTPPTARSPARTSLSAIGTRLRRELPRVLEDRHARRSTSRRCRRRSRARSTWREPKPGEPYRVLLTADGFATHVKLLGTVEHRPRRRAS